MGDLASARGQEDGQARVGMIQQGTAEEGRGSGGLREEESAGTEAGARYQGPMIRIVPENLLRCRAIMVSAKVVIVM